MHIAIASNKDADQSKIKKRKLLDIGYHQKAAKGVAGVDGDNGAIINKKVNFFQSSRKTRLDATKEDAQKLDAINNSKGKKSILDIHYPSDKADNKSLDKDYAPARKRACEDGEDLEDDLANILLGIKKGHDSSDDENKENTSDESSLSNTEIYCKVIDLVEEEYKDNIEESINPRSTLARKRKDRHQTQVGRIESRGRIRRVGNQKQSDPNSNAKIISQRVREFGTQGVKASSNGFNLFCSTCSNHGPILQLALKASSIKAHLSSITHRNNIDRPSTSIIAQLNANAIEERNHQRRQASESFRTPDGVETERLSLATALMLDAIPMNFLASRDPDHTRAFLERSGNAKLNRDAVAAMIPTAQRIQMKRVADELKNLKFKGTDTILLLFINITIIPL